MNEAPHKIEVTEDDRQASGIECIGTVELPKPTANKLPYHIPRYETGEERANSD